LSKQHAQKFLVGEEWQATPSGKKIFLLDQETFFFWTVIPCFMLEITFSPVLKNYSVLTH
jgi:hypothetical protein